MLLSKDPVDFPCVYATKGFKAHEHLYVFVDSEDPSSPRGVQSIAAALRQYISRSKTLGPNTSLVVLTPETNAVRSLEEYNRMFWDILHGVSKLDSQEWPADIPQDIDTPRWRFCFEGEQWFTVALTPAHRYRRSRRASCFCVLFQPKWVFDVLFSTPLKKQGAMDKVRGLLAVYDDVNISPEMKPYGDETGREYKQYFLLDENKPTARELLKGKIRV
ncbi:MAG: hypothetical protein Q9188_006434 [Gyalolechia gomerana]